MCVYIYIHMYNVDIESHAFQKKKNWLEDASFFQVNQMPGFSGKVLSLNEMVVPLRLSSLTVPWSGSAPGGDGDGIGVMRHESWISQ